MHLVPSSIFGPPLIGLHRPMLAITTINWPNSQPTYHRSSSINPLHPTMPHLGQGVLYPARAHYASHATYLPSAFSTMTLQDPTWHMDTEFDAFGLSVKDFLTRHILLRCDSSGDLYPVTKPLNTSTAFLSISIVKPIDRLSVNTFSISPIPKNLSHALYDTHWRNAMYDEYNALVKNGTWLLAPRPVGVNMVRSMWLFKYKFHADRTLSRYKARLVANGSSQQLGVDFDETFSPVIKSVTIHTVLSLVVSCQWPTHILAVKNAFLNGDLSKTVMPHVLGFIIVAVILLCSSIDRKYALQLLERAHMVNCNPSQTPVDTESKLDLSYAVQRICLYMHNLREPHFAALKRILRYVQGTVDFGLQLYVSATTSLVGYTDADWVGCPFTRRSTSAWLHNLLRELHSPLSTATLVYCDNISAVYMSANPVQHQRTKHIEIDIHFVRDMVTAGQVRVLYVHSRYQYADIFTK
ncbi:ribonuclease H-like domain-containing protein [Tanacetum coccineum]